MPAMHNLRKYGKAPFSIVVVHGGPGAGGEMAPVARELASAWGVLEPIQTAAWLAGQIEELRTVLAEHADLPVTLIGFSWGAWLSFLCAAHYPTYVNKLILVGSGPYAEEYAASIRQTRFNRLSKAERTEVQALIEVLDNAHVTDKNSAFVRFGALFATSDAYDPITDASAAPDAIDCRADIFQGVWPEAAALRQSGQLLQHGTRITCPVVAIHGDYDPHPVAGVQRPLSRVLQNFRCILLEHCGHKPWIEKHARAAFYRILTQELRRR